MNQRDFVQLFVVENFNRTRPHEPGIERLVYEGKLLWQRLAEHGFGASREHQPREHLDWYASLSPDQRDKFNRFWEAFALKRGRAGAAMRWGQINPDPDLAEHIIDAAAREAEVRKHLAKDQTPIMAQGWLHQRRWEDYTPSRREAAAHAGADRSAEIRRLRAEIQHVERLAASQSGSVAQQLQDQVEELRGRLAVLEAEGYG